MSNFAFGVERFRFLPGIFDFELLINAEGAKVAVFGTNDEIARFFRGYGTFGENSFLVTVNVTAITAHSGSGLHASGSFAMSALLPTLTNFEKEVKLTTIEVFGKIGSPDFRVSRQITGGDDDAVGKSLFGAPGPMESPIQ